MKCACGKKHPANSQLFEAHKAIFDSAFKAIVQTWVESATLNPSYTNVEIEHVKGDPWAYTGRDDIFDWEKKKVLLRRILRVRCAS